MKKVDMLIDLLDEVTVPDTRMRIITDLNDTYYVADDEATELACKLVEALGGVFDPEQK